jgi:hypothetical protein
VPFPLGATAVSHNKLGDIAARLAAADPANTGWQHDLAFVKKRIAGLEQLPSPE